MVIRYFKTSVLLCTVILAAACSSGPKGHQMDVKKTAAACTGEFVSGGTIVCEQPSDFVEGCQCFLQVPGHEFYVHCQSTDDRHLSVTLPTLPANGDLVSRCGAEDPSMIAKGISFSPAAGSADTAGGTEDIAPSGGPSAPTSAECTLDTDCVAGSMCGTHNTCVERVGTPSTPTPDLPEAPSALTVSFVTGGDHPTGPVAGYYGLARIHYQIQGGGALRAKYIYFPTRAADCTHGNLVTANNGVPLSDPTQPYNSGAQCVEADGNCLDFPPVGDPFRPLPVFCRVELPTTSGSFYVKLLWPATYVLAAQADDGTWRMATKEFTLDRPDFTVSSVTVSTTEPTIDINASATNTTQQLAVTGCPATATVNDSSPDGRATFTATCPFQKDATINITATALGGPIDNVTEQYRIHCEDPTLSLTTGGTIYPPLGGTVSPLDCPGTSSDRWWENCNAPVELDFSGSSSRTCTVSHVAADGSLHEESVTVPWVRDIQIKAYPPTDSFASFGGSECGAGDLRTVTPSTGGGTPLVNARLPRNHYCSRYKVIAHDFDDREFVSDQLNLPYKHTFQFITPETDPLTSEMSVTCHGEHFSGGPDTCDRGVFGWGACGRGNSRFTRQDYLYQMDVRHMASLMVENSDECPGDLEVKDEHGAFHPIGSALSGYESQEVYFKGSSTNKDTSCRFMGVDHNGQLYRYTGESKCTVVRFSAIVAAGHPYSVDLLPMPFWWHGHGPRSSIKVDPAH